MEESVESEKEKATGKGKGTKSGNLTTTEDYWQRIKDIVIQIPQKENLSCGLLLENVTPEGKGKKIGKVGNRRLLSEPIGGSEERKETGSNIRRRSGCNYSRSHWKYKYKYHIVY